MRRILPWLVALWFAATALPCAGDNPRPRDDRELHVVGLYEGNAAAANAPGAEITVNRPGKRVTLVLTAYESVRWQVKTTADTKLEAVILGGHEPQTVVGAEKGVRVVKAFRGGDGSAKLSFCYDIERPSFRALVANLAKLSPLSICSFCGRHVPEATIVIDAVQNDSRLSVEWPPIANREDLPDLLFPATHLVFTDQDGHAKPSFGDFILQGPDLESLKPLPRNLFRLTIDPNNKKYYGIIRNKPVAVDLVNRTTKELDMGIDVPKLSGDADITVDSRRGKVLVVSTGDGGFLYALDSATGAWSVAAEKLGVASIAYHRKHDCLYGVGTDGAGGRQGKPFLRQFSPSGDIRADIPLDETAVPGSLHGSPTNGTQVIAVDEFVVIVAAPLGPRDEGRDFRQTYIYLVEPKTGKAWITYKSPH